MGLAWWHRDVGAGSSQRVLVEGLGCRDPVKTSLAEVRALVYSHDAIPAVNGELVISGFADLAEEIAAWANKVSAKDSGWGVFFAEVGASGVSCGGHGRCWLTAQTYPAVALMQHNSEIISTIPQNGTLTALWRMFRPKFSTISCFIFAHKRHISTVGTIQRLPRLC